MAKMSGLARDESLHREGALRKEIITTIDLHKKESAALAAQVTHLTSTVRTLDAQLNTNTEFSMDAVQQVRDEVNARFDALASNAGGTGSAGSKDVPLVNSSGKPEIIDSSKIANQSVICSYCNGDVPKSIAKHCIDCDCNFHPGHYQLHRDEWPCPFVDHDLCAWCAHHIDEHENVLQCNVCHYTMHATCFVAHNPCPDGWNSKDSTSKKLLSELDAAKSEQQAPATPPAEHPETATTAKDLATKFLADMEAIQRGGQIPTYPMSPSSNAFVP